MQASTFGKRVRARREYLGMSQEDLAKSVGLSQVSIAKIEKGGSTRYAEKIANALKTTVENLENGEDLLINFSPSLPQSINVLADALRQADEITIAQVGFLFERLSKTPSSASEIVPRISALLTREHALA